MRARALHLDVCPEPLTNEGQCGNFTVPTGEICLLSQQFYAQLAVASPSVTSLASPMCPPKYLLPCMCCMQLLKQYQVKLPVSDDLADLLLPAPTRISGRSSGAAAAAASRRG